MADTLFLLLIMMMAFFGEGIKYISDQLQSHELPLMLGECFYLAKRVIINAYIINKFLDADVQSRSVLLVIRKKQHKIITGWFLKYIHIH